MRDKIEEAIHFLKCQVWPSDIAALNVSGGKDSTVLAHLTKLSGVKHNIYHGMTTIDPPELYKYVTENYPNAIIVRPKKSYWKFFSTWVVPSRSIRWCCGALKHGPLNEKIKEKINIIGTRAEESTQRKSLPRVNHYYERNQIHIYPLLYWTEADIWRYIEMYNLPYCKLYDEGFDRTGCIICPMRGEKQHNLYKERYPGVFKAFEIAVKKLWNKRISQGKSMHYNTVEEYLENWYKNSNSRWYKK